MNKQQITETDFLPSTIALRETPPSSFPRYAAWIIIILATIAFIWAYFGMVDVVATATGKIISNTKSKTIQSLQTATIKHIFVKDGMAVKQGDKLVEFDNTQISAEQDKLINEYKAYFLQKMRSSAMLKAIEQGSLPNLHPHKILASIIGIGDKAVIDDAAYREARVWLDGNYHEYVTKNTEFNGQITQRKAEQASMNAQISKLAQTLPIAEQEERDYLTLVEENFVARHSFLQKKQISIEQKQDLDIAKHKYQELAVQIQQINHERNAFKAQIASQNLASLNEAEQKLHALEQQIIQSQYEKKTTEIYAPISGTVQQLSINTIGGVVTPAQALMLIVPNNEQLEIEAFIENKDIGFIKIGADVAVKIDTFPYTKYGTIPAIVSSISQDAIVDEKKGLIYGLRLKLLQHSLTDKTGAKIKLSAGMSAQCDIKIKERKLIEYFLSPLVDYQKSSFHER